MVLCLSHVHSFIRCWNPSSKEGSVMPAQPFSAEGPKLSSVGGKNNVLLNGHEWEELITRRCDFQAVSQGWVGRTEKKHGGQECPAPQL